MRLPACGHGARSRPPVPRCCAMASICCRSAILAATRWTTVAADVLAGGGTALVLRVEEPEDAGFIRLFERSADYAALLADAAKMRAALTADTVMDALRQIRKLRKSFASLAEIDFFPGEAQRQADAALQELELAAARVLAPDEPHPVDATISRLSASQYKGRTWATRRRPWVDRLACAWLIRRFIDPQARLLWLESPADCPADALGFDFDGATSATSPAASASRCCWPTSALSTRHSGGSAHWCITSMSAACSRPRLRG